MSEDQETAPTKGSEDKQKASRPKATPKPPASTANRAHPVKQPARHRVTAGETLQSIADKYKMDVEKLRKLNRFDTVGPRLIIGRSIRINPQSE